METRKITIVATREQKKYVIESAAATLGELKADLDNVGINYDDMTFMEGLTRTEILRDDSLLPHDVERVDRQTGETIVTNELVFMLTNTEKKIRSGASTDRKSCYDFIKSHALENAIKETFGKNFTQVKTEDLTSFISQMENPQSSEEDIDLGLEPITVECVDTKARQAILMLAEALDDWNSYEFGDTADKVMNLLKEQTCGCTVKGQVESPYSDDEINDMFADLK